MGKKSAAPQCASLESIVNALRRLSHDAGQVGERAYEQCIALDRQAERLTKDDQGREVLVAERIGIAQLALNKLEHHGDAAVKYVTAATSLAAPTLKLPPRLGELLSTEKDSRGQILVSGALLNTLNSAYPISTGRIYHSRFELLSDTLLPWLEGQLGDFPHLVPRSDDFSETSRLIARFADAIEGISGTGGTKGQGRKKADYETQQADLKLVQDWKIAKGAGESKVQFARRHGLDIQEFENIRTRVAKREKPL